MADIQLVPLQAQIKSEQPKSQEKQSTEKKDNLTEEVIAELDSKLKKELESVDVKIAEQKSLIEALSAGHEKELEALKMRDDILAARDAEIAESELSMEKNRLEIENIKTVIQNISMKKDFQERDKAALEKRRDKLKVNREEALLKSEKYVLSASEYAQKNTWLADFFRKRCEVNIRQLAEEVNKINEELSNVEKDIQAAQKEINATDEMILFYSNAMEEKADALKAEELKTNQKKETQTAEKAGAQGAMPDWYVKYKDAESALNEAKRQEISTRDKIEHNADRVAGMRKIVLWGENNTQKEVLVSEEGEVYGDTEGVEEGAKRVSEEQKVAAQIRALEVFKAVNRDTIQEFLKYNPQTGEKFGEGEEVKSDVALDRSMEQLGDKLKEFTPTIQEIADSPKLAEIESLLFEPRRPLRSILLFLISDIGVSAALKEIEQLREWVMSDEFRKENPFKYNVAAIIVNALGNLTDISDKGEYSDKTVYKSLSNEVFVPMAGNKIGGFIATLVGLMDTKSWAGLIGQAAISIAGGKSKVASNANGVIKGALTGFEEGLQASLLSSEIDAWQKRDNPQMLRIVEAARRTRINNSVNGFIDTGASATKMALANGPGLGTLLGWGISLASAGVKFLVGKGFEKYDESALLKSPYVFGGLHYDTKLVKDEKFNTILREHTGITSKEKVYSAIKTTDAIAIHQRMMKSLIKPDYEVERVMSSLGYQDKVKYPNIRITDIMKKTGHEAAGGDWRRELKDTLLVEGKDYRTLMQSIGDGLGNALTKKSKINRRRNRAYRLVG